MARKKEKYIEIRIPRISRRALVYAVALLAVLLIMFILLQRGPDPGFPEKIRSSGIELYYPGDLPRGFKLEQTAYDPKQNVVSYSTGNGERRLFFTLQSKPEDFDEQRFKKEHLSNAREIESGTGTAYIGFIDQLPAAGVVTDKTLVLITLGPKMTTSDLEKAIKSLDGV